MPPVTNCMTMYDFKKRRRQVQVPVFHFIKLQYAPTILSCPVQLKLKLFKGPITLISHKRQVPIKTNFSQEKVFLAAAVQRNCGLWAVFTDCRRPRVTLCLDMKLDQKKFEHFFVLLYSVLRGHPSSNLPFRCSD